MDQATRAEVTGMWGDAFRYDVETAPCVYDFPFWEELVRRGDARRILELGCGTGRLAVPLIEAARAHHGDDDVAYVGVDFSAEMLSRFGPRLAEADPAVQAAARAVEMDMCALELDEDAFDLVVIALNNLAYLHTRAEQVACLAGAAKLLADDGRLAFEVLVPRLARLAEGQGPLAPPLRLELDFGVPEMGVERFLRTSADHYDPVTQTETSRILHDLFHTDGRHERFTHELRWHMYFPAELEMLVEAAGMRVVERYGSVDFAPFGPRSSSYLWVCGAA